MTMIIVAAVILHHTCIMWLILFSQVGTDFLEEAITAFEDHVQSVDVAAFNKV